MRKYSATKNQLELIEKILKDYPDSIEMLEYDDFIKSPTLRSGSFLSFGSLKKAIPEIIIGEM